ncbi:hypothetical protein SAMN05421505_11737 [Sinosporangium album]|uniref:4-amino-4-deoxy-L-arabinose transferase n=1 Tax=Sinosporangium album TaxID=504805 RepID=A0A1G8CZQ8_9ACTN|nr:hypothetical protein [Sinosporangium album]SDH50703.1 hypothetical protein SAMN05421505_11737 [Sinosporangium album]
MTLLAPIPTRTVQPRTTRGRHARPRGRHALRGSAGTWTYLALSLVVMLWGCLVTSRHVWAGDWPIHLATVREFAADPAAPADPMTGEASRSPYLSPYMAVLGLVSALTGATPRTVLECAGLVNLALLLWSIRLLCRVLSPREGVAVLAVVFTLLLWGVSPLEWSGVPQLRSLSDTLAYPSTFATALMLLCWTALLRRRLAVAAPLFGLILLVHPFTAVNTALGVFAVIVVHPRTTLRTSALFGLWVAVAAAWPYVDLTLLVGEDAGFSEVHSHMLVNALGKYGLALIGVPFLIRDRHRPHGRVLLTLFAAATALIALGVLLNRMETARAIPVLVLASHLALARALGDALRRGTAWRAAAVVTALCCVAGLVGARAGLARMWPLDAMPKEDRHRVWRLLMPPEGYEFATSALRPGETVLAGTWWARKHVMLIGGYPLPSPWPYPYTPTWKARHTDGHRFFDPSASAVERAEIARRYGARCALGHDLPPVPGFEKVAQGPAGAVLLCQASDEKIHQEGRQSPR